MSDMERPKYDNKISLGSIFTILCGVVAAGAIVGTAQSEMKALGQRLDASDRKLIEGDRRDEKTIDAIDLMRGAIIEMRGEQKVIKGDIERQNRQLDRIEQLLQGTKPPPTTPNTRP